MSACTVNPPVPPVRDYAPPAVERAATGSIYDAGTALSLYEDQKARRVGDVLTVLLVERTNAQTRADTETGKETQSEIGNPTLFGRPLTVHGVPVGAFGLGSEHSFEGGGSSSQSNRLEGSVSVIVEDVLANGNLVVRGVKQIALNQGDEAVSVEGVVRPQDIGAGNTVTSDRIANARITYAGEGPLAESNSVGWLARFFGSPLWPF